ncbi:MAG: homoserine O-acetyltransferase, partial [Dermatophilaceae bacterium]|nr:homoserine O-acetyltransferase [Dermatophilaceae bacterium]
MTVTHRTQSTRRPARPATGRTAAVDGRRVANEQAHDESSRRQRPDGAWRDGDPVGRRRFATIGDVELERGGVVPDVRLAYETWGRLNEAKDNVILVEHALTGDSHVVGEAGDGHASPGWWNSL